MILRGRSIRAHILLIVLSGGILPLTLIGVWLTASAVRSGKALLREQLNASLSAITKSVQDKWALRQGDLLLLADNLSARHAVDTTGSRLTADDSVYLANLYRHVSRIVPSFAYVDVNGRERWSSAPIAFSDQPATRAATAALTTIRVVLPTHDDSGRMIGHLDARLAVNAILSADSTNIGIPGAVLAVRDSATRTALSAQARDSAFNHDGEVRSGDTTWLVVRGRVAMPPLQIAIGAPTAAFVSPFESAARAGLIALLIVAAIALATSAYLTTRLTRPIDRLVDAASNVARGDLARRVEIAGPREIDTLASSFNAMTDSLQRMMSELSRRSALAAVGEFAASLAHEVRNALTAIKLDLQRAEERLPQDTSSRELVTRSLDAVTRLDSAVTGALRIGRSGTVVLRPLDLGDVLSTAACRTAPMFVAGNSSLDVEPIAADARNVNGDPAALQELFVNLFTNAAQALSSGGKVRASSHAEDGSVVVTVADNGNGIDAAILESVLEPFYTTRTGGTGLGLPIARQLALAHGGDLSIESVVGAGTTVFVRLPLLAASHVEVTLSPAARPAVASP